MARPSILIVKFSPEVQVQFGARPPRIRLIHLSRAPSSSNLMEGRKRPKLQTEYRPPWKRFHNLINRPRAEEPRRMPRILTTFDCGAFLSPYSKAPEIGVQSFPFTPQNRFPVSPLRLFRNASDNFRRAPVVLGPLKIRIKSVCKKCGAKSIGNADPVQAWEAAHLKTCHSFGSPNEGKFQRDSL
jgi:hypothetical protein